MNALQKQRGEFGKINSWSGGKLEPIQLEETEVLDRRIRDERKVELGDGKMSDFSNGGMLFFEYLDANPPRYKVNLCIKAFSA